VIGIRFPVIPVKRDERWEILSKIIKLKGNEEGFEGME